MMFISASGSTLVSHVDRLTPDDLETMTSTLITEQTYSCNNRLQVTIIGGFQDNKNVSQSQLIPILGKKIIFFLYERCSNKCNDALCPFLPSISNFFSPCSHPAVQPCVSGGVYPVCGRVCDGCEGRHPPPPPLGCRGQC